MDLAEQAALVTGASSGIGRATARALAAEGAAVAVAARREEKLQELAADIESDGGRALVVPTDVRDESAVTETVEATVESLGGLDILVNNAGVARSSLVDRTSPEAYRLEVEVNLLGAMYATHAALSVMLDAGRGHVVNVSSSNAVNPPAGGSGYNATKAGLNTFSETLRREVTTQGIRVTLVMPGRVVTEMASWEEWDGQPLDADDVARAIVYAVGEPAHVSVNELIIRPTDHRHP